MDIKAAIRTGVQALISLPLVAELLTTLEITGAAETFLTALGISLVTLALRWLETKFPFLIPFFSLGTSRTGPEYEA